MISGTLTVMTTNPRLRTKIHVTKTWYKNKTNNCARPTASKIEATIRQSPDSRIHTRQDNQEVLAGTKNNRINRAAHSSTQSTNQNSNMRAHTRPEKEPASRHRSQWSSEALGTTTYKTTSPINHPSQQASQHVRVPAQALQVQGTYQEKAFNPSCASRCPAQNYGP